MSRGRGSRNLRQVSGMIVVFIVVLYILLLYYTVAAQGYTEPLASYFLHGKP
jgi:hypothetical protein